MVTTVRRFADLVGQQATVERLKALALYCAKGGAEAGHVLLVGPSGMGKRTIAQVLASEMGASITPASGALLRKKGEVTSMLTHLEGREVLFLEDVQRLPRALREILAPALSDFRIDLIVGQGPGAAVHPFHLQHFMCVMTVPAEGSVPEDIRRLAPLRLALEAYSVAELTEIATRIATGCGISLEPAGAAAFARSCGGTPGQLEETIKRLARTKRGAVSGDEIAEFLSAYGLGEAPAAGTETGGNLGAANGIEFEKAISYLLSSMGFRCEMTKTTGDGGIDIVAVLQRPVLGGRYLIQCKRYAPGSPVGASAVREFYGAVTADTSAVKGILITTSDFTDQARAFAERVRIELIDGAALRRLLAQHGE